MTLLEKVKNIRLPFSDLIGIEFIAVDLDKVVAKMSVREDLCTLGGAIHGGAIMAFADSLGGIAAFVNLPEGSKGTTTVESKTNFVGAAAAGSVVIATATPIHKGRRTQVWSTRIETSDGRLVAVVSQTQLVL